MIGFDEYEWMIASRMIDLDENERTTASRMLGFDDNEWTDENEWKIATGRLINVDVHGQDEGYVVGVVVHDSVV